MSVSFESVSLQNVSLESIWTQPSVISSSLKRVHLKLVLPVSWRAATSTACCWHLGQFWAIGLLDVSNNLLQSVVGPAGALTYVKVSQAEKHLGPKPQSLTSTSFCNHPSPSLLLPLPLSLSKLLCFGIRHVVAWSLVSLVSLRREVTQYYCSACRREQCCPVTQVSYICSRQMGSQAFQCPLSSCVILPKAVGWCFQFCLPPSHCCWFWFCLPPSHCCWLWLFCAL